MTNGGIATSPKRMPHEGWHALQQGVFWIGTERTLTKQRHYNLVYLHARRKTFPAFAEIVLSSARIWPWGEVASVEEIESRLTGQWPANLVEAAIWKLVADSAAAGHLLVDLEQHTLDRTLPLALLPPDAAALRPRPLPDTLLQPYPGVSAATIRRELIRLVPARPLMPPPCRSHNESSFTGICGRSNRCWPGPPKPASQKESGIRRSTLARLVSGLRKLGQIACVPHGSYHERVRMHPAFQECIRRLYLLPTRLSKTAIHEHTEMQQVVGRL